MPTPALLMIVGLAAAPGPSLPPPVLEQLAALQGPRLDYHPDYLAALVGALEPHRRENALAAIRGALGSDNIRVRTLAAEILGELGDNSGVPVMILDLGTPDPSARGDVAVALRVLRDERSVGALVGALRDPSAYVRYIALAALGELGALAAFDDIAAHLDDNERTSPGSDANHLTVADAAAYALGTLADPRAIPHLLRSVALPRGPRGAACRSLDDLMIPDAHCLIPELAW